MLVLMALSAVQMLWDTRCTTWMLPDSTEQLPNAAGHGCGDTCVPVISSRLVAPASADESTRNGCWSTAECCTAHSDGRACNHAYRCSCLYTQCCRQRQDHQDHNCVTIAMVVAIAYWYTYAIVSKLERWFCLLCITSMPMSSCTLGSRPTPMLAIRSVPVGAAPQHSASCRSPLPVTGTMSVMRSWSPPHMAQICVWLRSTPRHATCNAQQVLQLYTCRMCKCKLVLNRCQVFDGMWVHHLHVHDKQAAACLWRSIPLHCMQTGSAWTLFQ